jgi:hypothetical protein
MLVWGVRIKRDGCRAFAEARFGRKGETTYSVQDLDLADLKGNARVLADLDLLRAWKPPGGRPRDDREERCRQFAAGLPSAICRARDAREERGDSGHGALTQYELAEAFGWHEDTLRGRLTECDTDWANTKRRQGSRVAGADIR